MLKLIVLGMVDNGGEEPVASCEIHFKDGIFPVSMWRSDYVKLCATGFFGRGHRPTKGGEINRSAIYCLPEVEKHQTSFTYGLDDYDRRDMLD